MTPLLQLNPAQAAADYAALAALAAPLRVRYAVKANPHPALLAALQRAGAEFAVTSLADLEALAALGVSGERIACVSPGPPASLLRRCRGVGVNRLTVDDSWELKKVAALVPGSVVSVALRVSPAGRLRYPAAPLGCPLAELEALVDAARSLPVELQGIAVHVGSQCERLAPWRAAVALAAAAWRQLLAAGLRPRVLSLGGGLPVPCRWRVPGPRTIVTAIRQALREHFASPSLPDEVWVEPGRYLAAGAGVLEATVLAVERRPGRPPRVQLDVGRYHGLPEAALGIRYRYDARRPGPLAPCVVYGPLGEAADLIDPAAPLPPLAPGDRLWLPLAGAYTTCQAAYPVEGEPAVSYRGGPHPSPLPEGEGAREAPGAAWQPVVSGYAP